MDKPLTPAQCLELRDLLFAPLFPTRKRQFRRLAVLPGGGNNAQATVHYAFASPVWERAGYSDIDAGPFLDGHYSIVGLNSLSQYGLAAIGEDSRDA